MGKYLLCVIFINGHKGSVDFDDYAKAKQEQERRSKMSSVRETFLYKQETATKNIGVK